jgi:putative spermidine/putrescine transport system substrate-binding protein
MEQNMSMHLTRRGLMKTVGTGAAASAILGLLPSRPFAAAEVVAATYPGAFEESYRKILAPYVQKATGAQVMLTPILALDQVAKITASRSNPPFDVALLDEGPMLQALPLDIFEPFPADKSRNNSELGAPFQSKSVGPTVAVQLIGIAYNPKKVATPPTAWLDLWKPEYKGRVGLPDVGSSLGTVFMVEVAKLKGGGEKNIDPAFAALKDLLPNVGAIAPNPGALGTLFQQGQIDIAPFYFNNTLLIAAKGVDVAFTRPETGLVLVRTSMHIVKNTKVPDLALAYIDGAISAEVQQQLQAAPYYITPTNGKVAFSEDITKAVGGGPDTLLKNPIPDWPTINQNRTAWVKEFTAIVQK